MNEQERATRMIDELKRLEEEYGFDILQSVFTDRVVIRDRQSGNDYDIEGWE